MKPFYMRQNEPDHLGRLTVSCMDLVVPKLGEIIGQVKGVLDQGFSFFENQENYCDRLEGVGGKK